MKEPTREEIIYQYLLEKGIKKSLARFGAKKFYFKSEVDEYIKNLKKLTKKAKPNNSITKLSLNAIKKIGGKC